MTDTSTNPTKTAGTSSNQGKTTDPLNITWKHVLVIVVVIGGIIGMALPIAFHYTKAADTTSVLGVVLPAFTAILGAVLGTGVGAAAGATGKKAIQDQLSQNRQVLQTAKRQVPIANESMISVFNAVARAGQSSADQRTYSIQAHDNAPSTQIDIDTMDRARESMARLQGALESIGAADS